jgi:hypothetical protein
VAGAAAAGSGGSDAGGVTGSAWGATARSDEAEPDEAGPDEAGPDEAGPDDAGFRAGLFFALVRPGAGEGVRLVVLALGGAGGGTAARFAGAGAVTDAGASGRFFMLGNGTTDEVAAFLSARRLRDRAPFTVALKSAKISPFQISLYDRVSLLSVKSANETGGKFMVRNIGV